MADDSQERSLSSGVRFLAYNAMIIGRCKIDRNAINIAVNDGERNANKMLGERKRGIEGSVNATDLRDKLTTATLHNGVDVDAVANAYDYNDSNEQDSPSQSFLPSSALSSPVNLEEQPLKMKIITLSKDLTDSLPTCQIYKVDLTGNFYRCQGAAVGGMAVKIENWMRSRGAPFTSVGEDRSDGKEILIPSNKVVVSTTVDSLHTDDKSIYADSGIHSSSNFKNDNSNTSCLSDSHGALGRNEINGTNLVDDGIHLEINGTNLVDNATHLEINGEEAGRVADKVEADEDQNEYYHIEQEEGDDNDEDLNSSETLNSRTGDNMTPHLGAVMDTLGVGGREEEMQSERIRQEVGTHMDRRLDGIDNDTNSDSNSSSNSDMCQCLDIAQCCLDEVYGPSKLSNYTIQIATVQGVSLWG